MGMGEPLANLEAVVDAVDILCHPVGLQLSARKASSWIQSLASLLHNHLCICCARQVPESLNIACYCPVSGINVKKATASQPEPHRE